MAKIALLIGVSEYEPELNPLPASIKDVEQMERVLLDPEMGGFDNVEVLRNPDPQLMSIKIETLFNGRSKDDLVLFFFSGHGIKDDANKLYFATRITRKTTKGDLIRSTAVPASFVHEVMNNSRAKRQAIILDCCFSGAFDPSLQAKDDGSVDLQGQLGAEGRVVLASSSSTQYSFGQQDTDLSLYTHYLVEGIETGAGDRDEDGNISIKELHEYATSKVQATAPNMTPKLITLKEMGFEIILAKAKVADPELRYRRLVEKYASRGTISMVGRTILDTYKNQLSLSNESTKAIENEVLRPYQLRLENLQRYRNVLVDEIQREYPLSNYARSELNDLREILGLRREDVALVEQEEFAKVEPNTVIDKIVFPKEEENSLTETISLEVLPQYRKESVIRAKDGAITQPVQAKTPSPDEFRYQQKSSDLEVSPPFSTEVSISRVNLQAWQWACGFLFALTIVTSFSYNNSYESSQAPLLFLNWLVIFITTLFLVIFRPILWIRAVVSIIIVYLPNSIVFFKLYSSQQPSFLIIILSIAFINSFIVGLISVWKFKQLNKRFVGK